MILKAGRNDLCGARRQAVDQHGDRHARQGGAGRRPTRLHDDGSPRAAPAGRHNQAVIQKAVADIDRHTEQAARIAPQIDDQTPKRGRDGDRREGCVEFGECPIATGGDPHAGDTGLPLDEPLPCAVRPTPVAEHAVGAHDLAHERDRTAVICGVCAVDAGA
jgi:hypothetical protein